MITYGDMVTLLLTFFLLMIVILNETENSIYRIINSLLDETEQSLRQFVHQHQLTGYIDVRRTTKGVQLTISSGHYFDINSADIKPTLRPVLDQIGQTLRQSHLINIERDPRLQSFHSTLKKNDHKLDVEIRVEGHTDNLPIRGGKYDNNWELSSARALNVVQYLSKVSNISQKKFSALGYGEHRPVTDNTTEATRSRNRRVEIFIDADITQINGS